MTNNTTIKKINTMTTQGKETLTEVKTCIEQFAYAADVRDEQALNTVLDEQFRLVLNQMFGSTGLMLLDKQAYLGKIRLKEFGGDKREVHIEHLHVQQNNAMAQVTFAGSQMTIVTFIQLVRTNSGQWKILNDLPAVQ